jgi:hypothetical protein
MELETAAKWQSKAMKDEGNDMGDQCDLSMHKEEMQ